MYDKHKSWHKRLHSLESERKPLNCALFELTKLPTKRTSQDIAHLHLLTPFCFNTYVYMLYAHE